MMRIIKKSLASATLSEGLAFLLVVVGLRRDDDVIWATWYGKVGLVLHWPGMKVEDSFGGWAATIGVPLVLWFLVWLIVWFLVGKIKGDRTPNQPLHATSEPAPGAASSAREG